MTSTSYHDVKKVVVTRFYKMDSDTWVFSLTLEDDRKDWHNITMFLNNPDALGEFTDSLESLNAQS